MQNSKIYIGEEAYFEFIQFIIIHQSNRCQKLVITENSVFDICLN